MKKREEIPVSFTWNLQDILPSDQAWEKLFGETEEKLAGYKNYQGHLAESGGMLFSCLKLDEEISLSIETLYVYGKQKSDQDTNNALYQELAARARALSNRASSLSSFMVPEILSIEEPRLKELLKEDEGLNRYKRTLEIIWKKRDHTLSPALEEVLAKSLEATEGPSDIFNMFNNADVKFPEITDEEGKTVRITHGNYIAFMESRNRDVRKSAFEALYSVYRQFNNTLAATFAANVKQAGFYAEVRGYSSARACSLLENEIPEVVYDNLLDAVHENLGLLHQYVAMRKKAMGVKELHMYDIYVPMVSGGEKKFSFDQAKELVLEGLRPLGEEYVSLLKEGFENRWIDVYENEGKRSGAYSWGVYGIHPYVLLNYNGTTDSVFTLAHEMGHALHSWYSDQNQTYVDAGYRIFVAEVASTCNEALLIRHLLDTTEDKKERAFLVNHFLDSFRTTLFRQAMFAEFEAEVHKRSQQGEALTASLLGGLYRELNELYFGPDMVVDEEIAYEWSRIPHFYTPFYVYQYATGFSAAVALSSKILRGGQAARQGYFKFLSGGNFMAPIELLRLCGIDMSSGSPVKEALLVFKELLNEMKTLI